ncbi:hypothetical protein [Borreliella afzelii]|uniref:Uncharacterized protein n=1 Tax=Borreliella afzelii (strain PKo) TaxID=390236 RepID=Q0SNQ1_BORAP|nr:hypothetical protein [Borreliella afzelii]ABH01527.1 hypothetical protein BAPKO_0270 [Borreliella afzelii PKo]AJY72251.1 hypothetical protein BAFK78_256 [Borreliella afzelii K78]EEC20679.1 conserved hypothetical protein [Borreliella afzelii ACA-1]AEL69488.1 conserved hypothetical protein [Borreliella afzelii PKo]AIK18566.1 hypothetical protein P612_01305 [Borreliella afzelii Tom3107]
MKGFLAIKLSNNEYYSVLNLDDSSVKRVILGKIAGDTSIRLNFYVSEYEDFSDSFLVGSFFLDNLKKESLSVNVYFKVMDEILYVYSESDGIQDKAKFDLSLVDFNQTFKGSNKGSLLNDFKGGIGNDLSVENLGSEFDLNFEEKDDFVKKDVPDLSVPTINSLDLKIEEDQKIELNDSDFEGFDNNDYSYVDPKEFNLESKKVDHIDEESLNLNNFDSQKLEEFSSEQEDLHDLSVEDIIADIDKDLIDTLDEDVELDLREDFENDAVRNNFKLNSSDGVVHSPMLYLSLISLFLLIFFSLFLVFSKILKPRDFVSHYFECGKKRIDIYEKDQYV